MAFPDVNIRISCLASQRQPLKTLGRPRHVRTLQRFSANQLASQDIERFDPANLLRPGTALQEDPGSGTMLGKLGGADIVQAPVNIPFKPADEVDEDAKNFKEHWLVQFWRDFPSRRDDIIDANTTEWQGASSFLQKLASASRDAGMFSSAQAVAYWSYHLARSGFFTCQGLAGLVARNLSVSADNTGDGVNTEKQGMDFGQVIQSGLRGPLTEALATYYVDYANIQEECYKLPWDMTTQGHRQFSLTYILGKASLFITETLHVLDRRDAGKPDPVWMVSGLYPDYFLNTFHYQTDGWLSDTSASVYETSTETLFIGRQDAMQRSAMVPLADFMRGRLPEGEGTKVLEVGCGTGRFGTFLKDSYPRMQLTCSDLSPFYLAAAWENQEYWQRMRQPALTPENQTNFLQTAAENIAAADDSYDVVVAVYLFHELPVEAQKAAAQEMARVCNPGGMVIVTDSTQLGDRPEWDATLGGFGNFNEPDYCNNISTDLGALFKEAGLKCESKVMMSSTKTLSFTKPAHASSSITTRLLSSDYSGATVQSASTQREPEPLLDAIQKDT